jgi:inactivated superfamily I helicase
MSDRPTPETDAAWDKYINPYTYSAGDLRILAERLERERDEARAVAYDLAVIASHCLGSHGAALLTETSERIADTLKRWRELKQ